MLKLLSAIAAASLCAPPAFAHHSAAMFDHSKVLPLQGTVKRWQWSNPHSWLTLVGTDAKGAEVAEGYEVGSPNTMFRNGWRIDSFKPGDKINIKFMPRIDGTAGGMLVAAQPAGSGTFLTWLPKGAAPGQ